MKIRTPAKINIGLRVTGKRSDGYHNIETVFYPLGLYDEIEIEKSNQQSFRCSDSVLEQEKSNLVLMAVELLEREIDRKLNTDIYLKKKIPVGGGLGGGSSDGAATLLALNKIYDLDISESRLRQLALKLGSDVPYFLNPVPSFAYGRGEELTPINFRIPFPVLIVYPGIHIQTGMAFSRVSPAEPKTDLKKYLLSAPNFNDLKNFVLNDFEPIIFDMFPEIGEIKIRMYLNGAMFSLMSGTGSTVYGIFPDNEKARRAEEIFKQKYYTFLDEGI